jgi:hypothetical protein
MFQHLFSRIHDLQAELISLGVSANNLFVSTELEQARGTINAACRESENFQRRGLWNATIAAQMQKAVDDVMAALEAKIAAIRGMSRAERAGLGRPPRVERMPQHLELAHRDGVVFEGKIVNGAAHALEIAEAAGAKLSLSPAGELVLDDSTVTDPRIRGLVERFAPGPEGIRQLVDRRQHPGTRVRTA